MTIKKLIALTLLIFSFVIIPKICYAAITAASVTSGQNTTDATSFATASVTPGSNKLQLLAVMNRFSSTPPTTPTVTGNGLTWVQVNTIVTAVGEAYDNRRVTVFRAMGAAPSAGTITIDFGGNTQLSCAWSLIEFDGVNTGGTNGSSAVVQSVLTSTTAGNATSQTITLAAFASANNMAHGVALHWSNEATTVGVDFTEVHDITITEGTMGFQTQYKLNDTTVDTSWATNTRHSGIAIEIAEAAATTRRVFTTT